MPHRSSFRSLARLCETQASLASDGRTRRVLEDMAAEYRRKADHEEAFETRSDVPERPILKNVR
jgi:hypothetical protein